MMNQLHLIPLGEASQAKVESGARPEAKSEADASQQRRHRRSRRLPIVLAVLAAWLLAGCAAKQPTASDERDPWQGYNRAVFAFNEGVDKAVLKPVATGYRKITPDFVERGVNNFFSNLHDVPVIINDILQGKFKQAGSDAMRVVLNTTVGLLGFFDVATPAGYSKHDEDLGQTLATWGVGQGPYFVVPLIGPSTVRDFPGFVVDRFLLDPTSYPSDAGTRNALTATDATRVRTNFLDKEEIVREWSPDYYTAVKNYYLDLRESLINDGEVDPDDIYEDL